VIDTPFRIGQTSDECNLILVREELERVKVTFDCEQGTFELPLGKRREMEAWARDQKIDLRTISKAVWLLADGTELTFEYVRSRQQGRLCFQVVRIIRRRDGE
jgi:hypothetical protein